MSVREQAAREAFVYGVPAVTLYGVLHQLVLAPERPGRSGSFNRLSTGGLPRGLEELARPGPPASRPFAGWLDLRSGPVVLTAEAQGVGASVSATVLDLYAEQVGQLPSETEPLGRSLVLAGPSWEATVSTDVAAVHRCLTDLCLVVGHFVPGEAGGALPTLHPPIRLEQLEEKTVELPLPAPVPLVDVRLPPTVAFLVALDWMLPLMPTPPGEDELRAELETIGLGCEADALGEALAEDRLDGQLTEGLRRGWDVVRRGLPSEPQRGRSPLRAHHESRAVRVLSAFLGDTGGVHPGGAGPRRPGTKVASHGRGPAFR